MKTEPNITQSNLYNIASTNLYDDSPYKERRKSQHEPSIVFLHSIKKSIK